MNPEDQNFDPLVQSCAQANPPDAEGVKSDPKPEVPRNPTCDQLKARIDWLMRDTEKREAEQVAVGSRPPGAVYPPNTIIKGRDQSGKDVFKAHDDKIESNKNEITNRMGQYRNKNCPDPPDDPGLKNATDVANSENPTKADWERKNGMTAEEWLRQHPEAVRATAALAIGYVVYRILRFLPSLAPPLWPTIPENIAIP